MSYALVAYAIVAVALAAYAARLLRERRSLRRGLSRPAEADRG